MPIELGFKGGKAEFVIVVCENKLVHNFESLKCSVLLILRLASQELVKKHLPVVRFLDSFVAF